MGKKKKQSVGNQCLSGTLLQVYAEGGLPGEKVYRVEEHLKVCEQCRLELEMIRVDEVKVFGEPETPPPEKMKGGSNVKD